MNGTFTIIMTRLKKESVKKTTSATNERIRRIKDQKKVVNSKNNVKISEFHVKRLLESVENEPEVPASFTIDNNNGGGLQSTVSKLKTLHTRNCMCDMNKRIHKTITSEDFKTTRTTNITLLYTVTLKTQMRMECKTHNQFQKLKRNG